MVVLRDLNFEFVNKLLNNTVEVHHVINAHGLRYTIPAEYHSLAWKVILLNKWKVYTDVAGIFASELFDVFRKIDDNYHLYFDKEGYVCDPPEQIASLEMRLLQKRSIDSILRAYSFFNKYFFILVAWFVLVLLPFHSSAVGRMHIVDLLRVVTKL